ncbi:MAG: hypothetical protein IJA02_10615 [Clostridia bacterium]|nr:hypothetical protein [Clostridia bacterium]
MKRLISFVLCLVVFISSLAFNVSANNGADLLLSENGYYVETTIIEDKSSITRASTYTKSGSKVQTVRDADGNVLFSFTLKGTFTVNSGVSATCTSVSYTYSITDDAWDFDSANTSKSGNTASGTAIFKKKILFITTTEETINLTLQCDKNGNLS